MQFAFVVYLHNFARVDSMMDVNVSKIRCRLALFLRLADCVQLQSCDDRSTPMAGQGMQE